ncbi:hypothetical protein [Streptomyces mirabilis]|uniref:hypothetical protein n=1 Tax=Streptomyces mirabilis TaxID=68239 RepID=UPI0033B8E51D
MSDADVLLCGAATSPDPGLVTNMNALGRDIGSVTVVCWREPHGDDEDHAGRLLDMGVYVWR